MFGFGKKMKDAGEDSAADPAAEKSGGLASSRARLGLLALVLVAGLAYLAYEYLPALLDETPPPVPPQARRKPVPLPVVGAPAAAVPVAAAAIKPEPVAKAELKPEPVAKAEPKPEPEAKPVPKPAAKPAPKPAPMAKPKLAPMVVAGAPAPPAGSTPVAEPKPAAAPPAAAPPPASSAPAAGPKPTPSVAALPAVAPLRGPRPITPKYNDVMTAVLYGDREAASELLDLGRWVDKPDSNGLTPLMAAVLARDAGIVQLLLERGADPNLQAPGGEVALEIARDNGDGASESLLLKAGAKY